MAKRITVEIYPETHAVYSVDHYIKNIEFLVNTYNQVEKKYNDPEKIVSQKGGRRYDRAILKSNRSAIPLIVSKDRKLNEELPHMIMENKALLKKFMRKKYAAHFVELGKDTKLDEMASRLDVYDPQYIHHLKTNTPLVFVDDPVAREPVERARKNRMELENSIKQKSKTSDISQNPELKKAADQENKLLKESIVPRNKFMLNKIVNYILSNKPKKNARYSLVTGKLHCDENNGQEIQTLLKKELNNRLGSEYEIDVKVLPKARFGLLHSLSVFKIRKQLERGTFFTKNPYREHKKIA